MNDPVNRKTNTKSPVPENQVESNRQHTISARLAIIKNLYEIAVEKLGSHPKALKALIAMRKQYHNAFNQPMYSKVARVDDKYYFHMYAPGVPSKGLNRVQQDEINRVCPFNERIGLRLLLLAITTRCPLNCEHCFEWQNLRQAEVMSSDELLDIVLKYQQFGTGLIFFSGGEPMVRYDDLLYILEHADNSSDFWMYTSGFLMDEPKATDLKKAGLTGVMVSLDSHIKEQHDKFRGRTGVFRQAMYAIEAIKSAQLVTGLALCPTRTYATEENIRTYLEMAHDLGVAFVQILEPRASGKYKNKDVVLSRHQSSMLDQLMDEYNNSQQYKDYPIIRSPATMERRMGCLAGDRSIYINSRGILQRCPFCSTSYGSATDRSPADVLEDMRMDQCPAFELGIRGNYSSRRKTESVESID